MFYLVIVYIVYLILFCYIDIYFICCFFFFYPLLFFIFFFFFFQAEDGIRDLTVTGVQTCALPISYVVHESMLKSLPARPHTASGHGVHVLLTHTSTIGDAAYEEGVELLDLVFEQTPLFLGEGAEHRLCVGMGTGAECFDVDANLRQEAAQVDLTCEDADAAGDGERIGVDERACRG